MASGSYQSSTGTNLEIGVEWSSTQDTPTNSSSVRVRVYLSHYDIYCNALSGSSVSVGGETRYFTRGMSSSATYLQKTYIADETFTVAHASDGTKSVAVSASWVFNGTYNGHSIGTLSVSGTAVLDRIARASDFSCASAMTLGSSYTVTVTPASSSYTHRVKLAVGQSVSSGGVSSSTRISVTPHASLADASPNSASPQGTVTLETYSGNVKIGEKSKSVTFRIPDTAEFRPTFTLAFSSSSDSSFVTSRAIVCAKICRGTVSVTGASAKHSASVASRRISFGTARANGASYDTGALSAGTFTYSATVTDSRGISTTKSGSVTVLPYFEPYPEGVSCERCSSDGAPDDEGAYLKVSASSVFASLGGANSASLEVGVTSRASGATQGTFALVSGEETVVPCSLSAHSSYNAAFTVTDAAGYSSTVSVIVPTSYVDLNLNRGRARLGGYAERAGFECDWDALFDGDVEVAGDLTLARGEVADYVVEQGTSGIWSFRKWASGAAECSGRGIDRTYSCTSAYGALYSSAPSEHNAETYPQGLFISPPDVTACACGDALISPRAAGSASSTPEYHVIRPQSGSASLALAFSCRGRWKN